MIFSANAANDAALIAFSTRGPDRYADGSPVQVGECYALVWMRDGSEFAGIDMNGGAVDATNNEVVVAMPIAKARRNGAVHCPLTLFQIDAGFAAAHAGGRYALVLLDTRAANASGELVASGDPSRVNGWGFAAKSRVRAVGSQVASASAKEGEAAAETTETSSVPSDEKVPQPRITGIKLQGGYVVLTVKGTHPRLIYNIASGSKPGRDDVRRAAAAPVQGHERADREITVIAPMVKGQNFFRIVRN